MDSSGVCQCKNTTMEKKGSPLRRGGEWKMASVEEDRKTWMNGAWWRSFMLWNGALGRRRGMLSGRQTLRKVCGTGGKKREGQDGGRRGGGRGGGRGGAQVRF